MNNVCWSFVAYFPTNQNKRIQPDRGINVYKPLFFHWTLETLCLKIILSNMTSVYGYLTSTVPPSHYCSHTSPHQEQRFGSILQTVYRLQLKISTHCSQSLSFIIFPILSSILKNQPCSASLFFNALIRFSRNGLLAGRCLCSSCFPGVWMCVAAPSCPNRSLLKELARLPTNPLIPLQWGKVVQTSTVHRAQPGVLKH